MTVAASAQLNSQYVEHLATLEQRWQAAMEAEGIGKVAVFAGSQSYYFQDDRPVDFHVNPHFKVWLPLLGAPDSWIVIGSNSKPRLIFVQPRDYWHQPPGDPDPFWSDQFDITVVNSAERAAAALGEVSAMTMIGEHSPISKSLPFAHANPTGLMTHLDYDRAYKTDYELACMRMASQLGCQAHLAAERAFRDGLSEYEIHLAYCAATGLTEAQLPYTSIVALNSHGAVLHYQNLERVTDGKAGSFLIDAGASHHGYASDITRTYARGGGHFQDLIDSMNTAQLRLVDGARTGEDYASLHLSAHHEVASILSQHGIVRLDPEAIVELGISSVFLPHGLGHLLGLQVHDVGGLLANRQGQLIERPEGHPFLRLTRKLAEGMTLTIEPGLYFIDMLLDELKSGPQAGQVDWDLIAELRPFGGIRIEDNIAVTASGPPDNLTRSAFAELN